MSTFARAFITASRPFARRPPTSAATGAALRHISRTTQWSAAATSSRTRARFEAPFHSFSTKSGNNDDEPESHPDFMSQSNVEGEDGVKSYIDGLVKENPVFLFMKGTPEQPQCGFSYQVVRILHAQGADFQSLNVLENQSVREGIKEYSDWPTIPQLYIDGEFVGGCDIVTSMHQDGSLEEMLKQK